MGNRAVFVCRTLQGHQACTDKHNIVKLAVDATPTATLFSLSQGQTTRENTVNLNY